MKIFPRLRALARRCPSCRLTVAAQRAARLTLLLVLMPAPAWAQGVTGGTLKQVAFDQNLDAQVPLDLSFRDESGRAVRLADYFGKKPVILTLVYYRCPLLCGLELQGLARSLKPLAMSAGDQFEIVTISIDPEETPDLAAAKKAAYLQRYGRPGAERGWHFLTGKAPEITRLARTAGFRYVYDPRSTLYTHAAGLVVLTPPGRIARYFYGIDYPPRDLQFALMEASARRIGSPIARVLLFCYHYDAATGKYTLAVFRLTQVLGIATVLALASYMLVMFRRARDRARVAMVRATRPAAPAAAAGPGAGG